MAAAEADLPLSVAPAERALGRDEVTRRIRAASWAIMTVLDGARPYAVPMAYGYDGRRFFVATGDGRKRRALEAEPRVCLTIVDAPEQSTTGGYVVVLGSARAVSSAMSRLRAGFLILRRFSRGGLPSLKELRSMARGRIFRIDPHRVTGYVSAVSGDPPDPRAASAQAAEA